MAVIAAIAAVVSYLKLGDGQVLLAIHDKKFVVYWIFSLITYALLFELFITQTTNRADLALRLSSKRWLHIMSCACSIAYAVQVFGHIMFFVGIGSFYLGYADGFASVAQ